MGATSPGVKYHQGRWSWQWQWWLLSKAVCSLLSREEIILLWLIINGILVYILKLPLIIQTQVSTIQHSWYFFNATWSSWKEKIDKKPLNLEAWISRVSDNSLVVALPLSPCLKTQDGLGQELVGEMLRIVLFRWSVWGSLLFPNLKLMYII